MNHYAESSPRHMLSPQEYEQRIGQLCRNGRTVYYATLGDATIESHSREEICMRLDMHADRIGTAIREAKVKWSPSKRWHLLRDVGMYKATVKRNFYDNDRGPELDHVAELLKRRTQFYTVAELTALSGFFVTAHDECVWDNPDEFEPLQRYVSIQKCRAAEAALARLAKLQQ